MDGKPFSDDWIPLGVGTLLPGELKEATVCGRDLVIWRTASGTPCVMEARCPHQWSHLASEGAVDGEEIVCLAHFWRFDIEGKGWKENVKKRRDKKGDIEVYSCGEEGGDIWVKL